MRSGYDDRGTGYDSRKDDRGHNDHNSYNNNDRRPDDYGDKNGYNNPGYGRSISQEDFFAAERVMDRENDNGRLIYAKRLADDNLLCAEQVKELARFFSFDDCRLAFVKYAYGSTIDKNNFSVVVSAFSSGNGRGELMAFLSSCR